MPIPETLQLCQELLRQYDEAAVKPDKKTVLSEVGNFTLCVCMCANVNWHTPNSAWIEIFYKKYLILRTLNFVNFGWFNISWDDRFHVITVEDFLHWLSNLDIDWDEICYYGMSSADVAKLKEGNVQRLPRTKNANKV